MNGDAIHEVVVKVLTRWLKLLLDKSAVFSICVISILVLLSDGGLRAMIWTSLTGYWGSSSDGQSYFALVIACFAVYFFLSAFFRILLDCPITHNERQDMGVFALCIHGIVGIAAGVELLDTNLNIWAVFPIWNIVTGVAMLYLMALAPEKAVSDRDESLAGILIAALVISTLFLISMFVLKLSSAMTMSVCVSLSISLSPEIASRFTMKKTNDTT